MPVGACWLLCLLLGVWFDCCGLGVVGVWFGCCGFVIHLFLVCLCCGAFWWWFDCGLLLWFLLYGLVVAGGLAGLDLFGVAMVLR